MLIIAHRGACDEYPENTLAAFRRAAELGVDAVELDIRCSRDGHLVVIHDQEVDRTTNGHGRVADLSLSELQQLDAGLGQHVPTLAEALELGIPLHVETKVSGVEAELVAAIQRALGPVTVSSFDYGSLLQIRTLAPWLPLGFLCRAWNCSTALSLAISSGATSLHVPVNAVDERIIRATHAAGLQLFAFTVDDLQAAISLRERGVDGIFTNRPRPMLAALRHAG